MNNEKFPPEHDPQLVPSDGGTNCVGEGPRWPQLPSARNPGCHHFCYSGLEAFLVIFGYNGPSHLRLPFSTRAGLCRKACSHPHRPPVRACSLAPPCHPEPQSPLHLAVKLEASAGPAEQMWDQWHSLAR